jgi:hypothetical protein
VFELPLDCETKAWVEAQAVYEVRGACLGPMPGKISSQQSAVSSQQSAVSSQEINSLNADSCPLIAPKLNAECCPLIAGYVVSDRRMCRMNGEPES